MLIVRNFDSVETRELKYTGGLHYPHLERIPGTEDVLSKILAPQDYKQPEHTALEITWRHE
jgi:hypothetical protein